MDRLPNIHPGEILREAFLKPMEIKKITFALLWFLSAAWEPEKTAPELLD